MKKTPEKSTTGTPFITDNPWRRLRQYTDARIGLGRAGVSLPTDKLLEFQLAHAQAQDAVHVPLDIPMLMSQLSDIQFNNAQTNDKNITREPLLLHSQAQDRTHYLQRPDLGRRLNEASQQKLQTAAGTSSPAFDIAVVIVDGLSSLAVQTNAPPFLRTLRDSLTTHQPDWTLAPLTIVEQGRVAIGDDIGERLNANAVVVLIGERPGLSSPDSLGLYFTWQPRTGLNDANRNCISNIRVAGLAYDDACARLLYLLRESRALKLSGVQLKDRTDVDVIEHKTSAKNFLIQD